MWDLTAPAAEPIVLKGHEAPITALAAMAICGLWHGPSWNFVIWGLYHGLGLSFATLLQRGWSTWTILAMPAITLGRGGTISLSGNNPTPGPLMAAMRAISSVIGWGCTMVFVNIGWLLFFYPIDKAVFMMTALFEG